jgi:hypothetical protein
MDGRMKKFWILPVLLLSMGLAGCNMFGNDGDDEDTEAYPIAGSWVNDSPATYSSDVVEFTSNGTYTIYSNYAMETVDSTGTWSLSNGILTIDGTETGSITAVSENEFTWNADTYYRKGYEPGGNSYEDFPFAGSWVEDFAYTPETNVMEFVSDGTYIEYSDYAMTTQSPSGTWAISSSGTWTISVKRLELESQAGGTSAEITAVSENKFTWDGSTYYRRGYEPGGNALSGAATTLTLGTTYEGVFTEKDTNLFSVTVEDGASYAISWDDSENGTGSYTGDIEVSAYNSDKTTAYFYQIDHGYDTPQTITADGTTMYIITNPYDFRGYLGGTYGLTVTKQ